MVALYYAVGIKHVTTVSYQLPQQGGQVAGYTAAQWLERLACNAPGWPSKAAGSLGRLAPAPREADISVDLSDVVSSRRHQVFGLCKIGMLSFAGVRAWTAIRNTPKSVGTCRRIRRGAEALLLLDDQGVVRDANPAFCGLIMRSREGLHGVPLVELLAQDNREVVPRWLPEEATTSEHALLRADGGQVPVALTVHPSVDRSCLVVVRPRGEAPSGDSASELRALMDAIPDAFFTLQPDGTLLSYHAPVGSGVESPRQSLSGKRGRCPCRSRRSRSAWMPLGAR